MQLFVFNEEFLVSASQQLALITSLPFVHTARRYYRLNELVRSLDRWLGAKAPDRGEVDQTWSFRGSTSRNKVSVGEPAEGSLTIFGGWLIVSHRQSLLPRVMPWQMRIESDFDCMIIALVQSKQTNITFNNGSLGSCNDEERSKVRKVMRNAKDCETLNL